jgi:hypothetical protein
MDDGFAVEVVEIGEDPRFEFLLGRNANVGSRDRAILEKKPSTRLSHEPCFGVNTKGKRPSGWAPSHLLVSLEVWAEWLSRITLMAVSVG